MRPFHNGGSTGSHSYGREDKPKPGKPPPNLKSITGAHRTPPLRVQYLAPTIISRVVVPQVKLRSIKSGEPPDRLPSRPYSAGRPVTADDAEQPIVTARPLVYRISE